MARSDSGSLGQSAANIPLYKIGAVFYGLWGFWHFRIVAKIFEFAATQMETGVLQARIYQGAFHILWFAVGAIAIAILFNWRNSRLGYWANLLMIGWTEVGLFLFFMLPGYFPWLPDGFVGPLVWLLAVVFSTLGYCLNPQKA
ncbi:MAG: hypothetical protein AAF810_14035 [Cyanobacteria bacterium P01_D01_bin.36]